MSAWSLLFFFSSRRRHTRFDCDWSSDVCSSDLRVLPYAERNEPTAGGQASDAQNQPPKKWVVVESPAIINGSELRSAAATQAQGGGDSYQISFALKPSGADKFGAWTGANINEYM